MPCRQPRHILGQLRQFGFAFLQHAGRLAGLVGGGLQPFAMAFARPGQFALLPVQPFDGFARIAVQPGLALHVVA